MIAQFTIPEKIRKQERENFSFEGNVDNNNVVYITEVIEKKKSDLVIIKLKELASAMDF
ncbi:hypothetical protein [Morganella morganii]|uniref:hypothetical protein n=1 Tax=Morganella morganii TaxID=582 RepID=UPI0025A638B3|nr:hypothetical protein [Morganella morganii]HDU8675847.1 hypothetical protein [Morganella morganii subsp. morganii]